LSDDQRIEAFINKVSQRPLPSSPMARVRTYAKELAEGATEGVWGASISVFRGETNEASLFPYLERRWNNTQPHLELLLNNNYIQQGDPPNVFQITKAAFDLLSEVEPASIFISYRRQDSSAFALLILARFKAEGLDAFLDLAIQPGDNWRTHLKEQIQGRDHLVLLLGPHTLDSEVVLQEAAWALESNTNIIPIWHGGYKHQAGQFNIVPELDEALQNTHTIRVLEESALAYNNAIVELLNFFGVTP